MMMYRSLVVGLLGAIALLVATGSHPPPDAGAASADPPAEATADDAARVVDVSRVRAGPDLMPLLGLAPGERVVSLDGNAADGLALATAWSHTASGGYLDVGVRGGAGDERRILVLVHP